MRPAGACKPRKGKRGPKKQPQRGLGVAQLEKLRLQEQSRSSSQQAREMAALQQLRASPPLLCSLNPAAMESSASIIDSIPPGLRSAAQGAAASTCLELFPARELAMATLIKDSDGVLSDRNWARHNPRRPLNLPYDHSNEFLDHGSSGYSLHRRQNWSPLAALLNCGTISRAPLPLCSLERSMELCFSQSSAAMSSAGEHKAIPTFLHSESTVEQEAHYRRSEGDCELRLRPPGRPGKDCSRKEDGACNADSGGDGRKAQNFLSLSVGSPWDCSAADASSATKPAITTSAQEKYTFPLVPLISWESSLSFTKPHLLDASKKCLVSTSDMDIDLALKL